MPPEIEGLASQYLRKPIKVKVGKVRRLAGGGGSGGRGSSRPQALQGAVHAGSGAARKGAPLLFCPLLNTPHAPRRAHRCRCRRPTWRRRWSARTRSKRWSCWWRCCRWGSGAQGVGGGRPGASIPCHFFGLPARVVGGPWPQAGQPCCSAAARRGLCAASGGPQSRRLFPDGATSIDQLHLCTGRLCCAQEEMDQAKRGGPEMPLTIVFVERKTRCDEVRRRAPPPHPHPTPPPGRRVRARVHKNSTPASTKTRPPRGCGPPPPPRPPPRGPVWVCANPWSYIMGGPGVLRSRTLVPSGAAAHRRSLL